MYLSPAHRLLLRRARPNVRVLDVQSNTTSLTTYTFSAVNVPTNAAANSRQQTLGTDQVMRSPSTKAIAVIVHTRGVSPTFAPNTATLGGVGGNELVDRNGATTAINTAIYTWPAGALTSITNTDIVVTHSIAVNSCAIGVLEIDNILFAGSGFGTSTNLSSAGALVSLGPVVSLANATGHNMMALGGTSSLAINGTETFLMGDGSTNSTGIGNWPPIWLYDQSNTNMSFAAWWYWVPGYSGGEGLGRGVVDWSGTAAFDTVMAAIA
jgi:hypothetical protein